METVHLYMLGTRPLRVGRADVSLHAHNRYSIQATFWGAHRFTWLPISHLAVILHTQAAGAFLPGSLAAAAR
jgi:hypothetical protein